MKKRDKKYFGVLVILLLVFGQTVQAEHAVKRYDNIVWAKPKGFELTADIYVPVASVKAVQNKEMPVLVIFHGGGWLLNTKEVMSDLAAYISSHSNIITVNTNYRRLGDVNNTTTANEIVEDAMGAVLWVKDVIKDYGGDSNKVAVTGDSAGGHLAAMVLLAGRQLQTNGFAGKVLGFTPSYIPKGKTAEQVAQSDGLKLQAAILSYAGFSLYKAALGGFESESNPFWRWAKATPRGMFGSKISAEKNPHYYQAVSPIEYVESSKEYALPPQFVLVGDQDQLTPPESAKEYVERLKKLGQPVTFTIYPGKGHGFLDSGCNEYNNGCFLALSKPVVEDMVQFLEKTLEPPHR